MSPDDGQEPGPPAAAWVPPPQHFAPPPRTPLHLPAPDVVASVPHRGSPPGRARTLLIGAVVIGVLAVAALAVTGGEEERPGPVFVGLPPVPPEPVPLSPAAGSSSGPTPPVRTSRVRDVPREADPTATGRRTPASSAPPAVVLPVVGQELGLEPVGEPGRRVRHRDFIARIDPVGPASPALDRADSRFTVRASPGGTGCVLFESVNYPGYYLRSRDLGIRLERPDGNRRFAASATFCPVPVAAGGFVLRSRSEPDTHVTRRDAVLSLDRVAPARAAAFVTRPPL